MEKLKLHSPNLTDENIAKIRELFPGCVTEAADESGNLRLSVDFDQLRQELSDHIVDGQQEHYRLDWPGKREALITANAPIAKTLRPSREESVEFDTTQHLFIEGDNLDGLKLIQETFLGVVKFIYIDPPYNTGNDFVYDDDFSETNEDFLIRSNQKDVQGNRLLGNTDANGRFHSDWLSMMYPRLRLAKTLLSDVGLIFVSIDTGEEPNLRKMMDEVFGERNFLCSIVWEKRFTRSNNAKTFATLTERVICYRKSPVLDVVREPRNEKADSTYSNPDNDPRDVWTSVSYVNPASKEQRPNLVYELTNPITGRAVSHPTNAWKYQKSQYEKHVSENRLYWGKSGENQYPRLKRFLSEMDDGMVPVDFWDRESAGTTDAASKYLSELMGEKIFDFPKPVNLISRAIGLANDTDGIYLDFFAGSGPTAEAVLASNAKDGGKRRFILVQLSESADINSQAFRSGYNSIAEIAKERIRRAGKQILEGECHPGWNKDVGFRVLKIDTSNMQDVYYRPEEVNQSDLLAAVDNIKPDRTAEDLLFQVLVDWGVDLTLPIRSETVQGKTVFFVDENALVACFDPGVTEDLVKELTGHKPLRVVFRDNGFVSDAVKINVEQIFRQLSPTTDVKSV
jgi:adenine-specific DNA-methyltransferase